MQRRMPTKPYRNLFLAALLGHVVGVLGYSAYLAAFKSPSARQSLVLLADAAPAALLALPVMGLAVVAYGLPVLWLALRLRLAIRAVAFALAAAPGVVLWVASRGEGQVAWLSLLISVATGAAYLLLAYRRSPSNNSSKPTPLRGAA